MNKRGKIKQVVPVVPYAEKKGGGGLDIQTKKETKGLDQV
jgi:hypothetical protein